MKFEAPLIEGKLVRRYQRFLAEVELGDASLVVAHSPNTGSMRGVSDPGSRVWLRDTQNSSRKYPLAWELVEAKPGVLVGINTARANPLVAEAIAGQLVSELAGYRHCRPEVRYGAEGSRIDLLLESPGRRPCYVEVKSVTLVAQGVAFFPDAVSRRGAKHLRELAQVARAGGRAAVVFCVQRDDAEELRPADEIDPRFGQELRLAREAGVELLAYAAAVSCQGIELVRSLPVLL